MQNEPNFKIAEFNPTHYMLSSYGNLSAKSAVKNEPKRTQNKAKFTPVFDPKNKNQSQNEANFFVNLDNLKYVR